MTQKKGRREALLVATSAYQDRRFQRLIAPLNDVKAFGAVLAAPDLGGFDVRTVVNKNAHSVMEEVERFCADRSRADTVLLYFSCHGFTSDMGDLFLVARNTDRDLLLSTAVPDSFLRGVMRRCRADARILILDCCFGGAFGASLLKGDTGTVDIYNTFREAGSGLVVLTASDARESAFMEAGDGGKRESVFSRTIVEGIRTGEADIDGDCKISADDLHTFAFRRIATNQSRQTPTISKIGGVGMIVVSQAKPRPVLNSTSVPVIGADNRRPDLRPWVRIHDVGPDTANFAVAAVTAMETNLSWQGSQVELSARYLHQKAKKLMGVKPEDQTSGTSWEVMEQVLTQFGTVAESTWPYRAGEWKLPRGKTQAAMDTEAKRYRARLTPVRSLRTLIDELNRGRPVLSTFTVHQSTWTTESVAKTGLITSPGPADQQVGTVAVTIINVDEAAKLLWFAHTWGTAWGDRGVGTMSLETARTLLAFDQMWSVELDAVRGGGFSWDLERAPAAPPKLLTDGLIRTVYDGRRLGASYTKLTRAAVLQEEGGKSSGDRVVEEVFSSLGAFHACVKEAFDRNSWDNQGGPYRAIVHFGRDFDNAFWDGGLLVLGDGDGRLFNGFHGLDVVASTLAEGLLGTTTSLAGGTGQSAALYRGLSLVFGSMVKQHAARQSATEADWLVGSGLLGKGVSGRGLHDLLHPGTAYDDSVLGKDPTVGHLSQLVRSSTGRDGARVNAGIPARAFALAAVTVGGPSWQQVGSAWYRALSPRLTQRTTFAGFAKQTVACAEGNVAKAIRRAWADVGVTLSAEP